MATEVELFGIGTRKVLWFPRLRSLSKLPLNLAIGHEHGAKLHFDGARKHGASENEVWETIVRGAAGGAARRVGRGRSPQVRNFSKDILGAR